MICRSILKHPHYTLELVDHRLLCWLHAKGLGKFHQFKKKFEKKMVVKFKQHGTDRLPPKFMDGKTFFKI